MGTRLGDRHSKEIKDTEQNLIMGTRLGERPSKEIKDTEQNLIMGNRLGDRPSKEISNNVVTSRDVNNLKIIRL